MGKHKKYIGKSDSDIQNLRIEEDKIKVLKKQKEWLTIDRQLFIENIMKVSDVIDKQISKQTEEAKVYDLTRSKNILQSLVYLILNDTFYSEVLKIRSKFKIPLNGLLDMISFENYASVFSKTEWLIKKYGLANKRDVSTLATILASFITRQLKFDDFLQKIVPKIYENSNSFLVRGFDVKVKELPSSEINFCKCQWVVKLYPFVNTTKIGNIIKDYFERDMIYEKNEKSYDKQWVKTKMSKLHINKKECKQKPQLEIKDGKYVVALKFTTDFFSKPSQIMNLYKEKSYEVRELLQKKEQKLKKIQEKRIRKNFSRNYSIYKSYREGIPYDTIYDDNYGEKEIPGSESLNTSKGEIGKFQAKIRDSIKRMIVF